MALGDLRRAKATLRSVKNQSSELVLQELRADAPLCCLFVRFQCTERGVLRCGHSFHVTPCLERLRGGASPSITCPMLRSIRTDQQDILIATNRRGDDGNRSRRAVKGSWGTKVSLSHCLG
jgi:hypothetical protein